MDDNEDSDRHIADGDNCVESRERLLQEASNSVNIVVTTKEEDPEASFSISNQFTLFHYVIIHPLFHLCTLLGFNLRIWIFSHTSGLVKLSMLIVIIWFWSRFCEGAVTPAKQVLPTNLKFSTKSFYFSWYRQTCLKSFFHWHGNGIGQ